MRNVVDLHEIPNHHLIPLNEREPCRKSRCFFFELKDVSAGAVDKNAPRQTRVVMELSPGHGFMQSVLELARRCPVLYQIIGRSLLDSDLSRERTLIGCSAAVAPYTTCELTFTFTPTAVGFRQAVIEITSPQVQFGQVIIPIGGTGE